MQNKQQGQQDMQQQERQQQQQQAKASNLKTALVLASIAAVFFVGIFIKRIWFS
jgi:hypothetical protein